MLKGQLRKTMLTELGKMGEEQYWESSKRIHDRLLAEFDFTPTDSIGITISRVPEVDTTLLIKQLWQQGVRVAAPKCDAATRTMQFYTFNSFDQLETVYMDLKEPNPVLTDKIDASDFTLLIVPGVVFSNNGYRIGFGGGYYDRFLSQYKGPTASLLFDAQLVEAVPVEDHDLPVDILITDKRTVNCKVGDRQ